VRKTTDKANGIANGEVNGTANYIDNGKFNSICNGLDYAKGKDNDFAYIIS
jgi:hypothetical protein